MLAGAILAGCAAPASPPPSRAEESAAALNQSAARAWSRGDLAHAIALYDGALAAAESVENFTSAGANLLNLALVHERLRQFEQAHARLDQILSRPALYGAPLVAQASTRKALLYIDEHDLDSALRWIDKAHAGCGDGCDLAATLMNMRAIIALERGDPKLALRYAARALELANSPALEAERANAYRLTGRAHSRTGGFGEAAAALEKALEIDRARGRPDRIALDLVYAAENEELRLQPGRAGEYYARALTAYTASGNRAGTDEISARLARIGDEQRQLPAEAHR
jgi:tetratricopeptide (TPR) repeat protein